GAPPPPPEDRQAAYRALFKQTQNDETLAAIRDATNKVWPLGSDRFKDELARLTERRVAAEWAKNTISSNWQRLGWRRFQA
ncbi:MAG: hypothetical protein K2X44_10165, partial [Magnetospirillum sp.]|nr:hypothetical protein [Magnetospirillum sp.]